LFAEYWPALAVGAAFVLGALGIRLKGKSDGRQEVQAQINKQAVEAAKEARDVQAKVNRMDDGAANAELNRKWVRDKGTGGS
jgi:phage tail sheath gpL-like